eukprot:scaffold1680_cov79-Cylindrotheca_fusiformis.AAC.5
MLRESSGWERESASQPSHLRGSRGRPEGPVRRNEIGTFRYTPGMGTKYYVVSSGRLDCLGR